MDWRWDDEYLETRSLAGLVTDVLGHTQTSRADEYLAEALSYRDPRIKAFAVIGLLRHGKAVEAADILAIASDAENRNMFYRGLKEIKRESLFPPNYRNQASFAESDMVGWLTYPTELGRAPDEIELMAIVPGKSSDGPTNYYLFRFRTREPHWSAKDGWMAGVSGPFLTADEPTTESNGDTFSSFTPWDSKTPAEHVASVTESLDKSREIWMKGQ
jgi:hypothetical protein